MEMVDVQHFPEGKLICLLLDGVLGLNFEERESICVLTGDSTSSPGENTSSTRLRLCGVAGNGSGFGTFRCWCCGLQLLDLDPPPASVPAEPQEDALVPDLRETIKDGESTIAPALDAGRSHFFFSVKSIISTRSFPLLIRLCGRRSRKLMDLSGSKK